MLREDQIDLRRERARQENYRIEKRGKNRVFADFLVTNDLTGGQYTVTIRGFDTGDNTCTCPDYRANTLGTCKHIEAVLEDLREDQPEHVRKRKATVTQPELFLHFGEVVRIGIQAPARHSDALEQIVRRYFDADGLWNGEYRYESLITALGAVPEVVKVSPEVYDLIDRDNENKLLNEKETDWLWHLSRQQTPAEFEALVKLPLYAYQLRGVVFLATRLRSILGDDMGLGKTVQALAAVEIIARERGISRVLIVAPASVKYQWQSEIHRLTGRDALVIEGLKDARQELYAQEAFYRIVNYEQVVRDLDRINECRFDLVILDEAQRIKNWESKTSKAVKKLKSKFAFALTGTVLENNLEELFSICQFVDERRLGPAFQFMDEYRVVDAEGNVVGYRNLEKLREKLKPIFLRRTRGEVLTELPPRTDNTIAVEMAEEQKGPYEDQRTSLIRLLQKNSRTEIDRQRILACIANMRLICDSTALFDDGPDISPKLDELDELLPELIAGDGHKVVIFSQWERMLRLCAVRLEKAGHRFVLLHGGLSGSDRKAILDQFQTDRDCKIFLSTDAGGTGLNLQVADTVVQLELPWNPAVLEQRIARIHRLGQERPVRNIQFVTRDTIEERVVETIEAKKELFRGLFESDADEIAFRALDQPSLVETLRDLIDEPDREKVPVSSTKPASEPVPNLIAASLQFLEVLADWDGFQSWSAADKARLNYVLTKLVEISKKTPT